MKKLSLDPLRLDKETIASLNNQQIKEVLGGVNQVLALVKHPSHVRCGSGGTICDINGGSTGCGAGTSVCFAK
ncbi:Bacteriocin-type signal sequence-containing protein [Tenacibaculum sp. 190524A02b]|uniref:Bacteriocin-type signal sequence-containing protein n=1 Tax=Tenacibaculum vairaonense TaxID=3137860 RepID=A0ABM9PPZ8_9FLAO